MVRLMIADDEIFMYIDVRIYVYIYTDEYSLLDTKCGNKNMLRMMPVLSNIKLDDENHITIR